jgi:DNA-binding transcriptional LysR family regulator
MLPSGLTLRNLEILVFISHCGSMRGAAELAHMTTPSVRDHVHELEQALGMTLVESRPSGTQLTLQGNYVLQRSRSILESVERLQEFCLGMTAEHGGVLSIACYPVHLERFLAAVLGEFRQLMPEVKLDLTRVRDDRRRHSGRSLFDELRATDVELAMGPPQQGGDLEGIHAYDARIVLMLPDDDPSRHERQVPVARLRDRPVMAAPRDYFSREKVAHACRSCGFELIVEIESASPPALIALGQHRVGLPVLPDDYDGVRRERFPYPVLTYAGEDLLTPVGLQWRADEALSAPASTFVTLARRHAEANGHGHSLY